MADEGPGPRPFRFGRARPAGPGDAPARFVWRRRLGRGDPPPLGVQAEPAGFSGVRFVGNGEEALVRFFGDFPRRGASRDGESFKILAMSGGGAGGAFGAGALIGLSKAGSRPTFDMVTGVSTGALIAPFAFLGSEWDHRLAEAYTGGYTSQLLALTSVRPGLSLYPSEPLTALVTRYVDEALLVAVAKAYADGRRLFVSTANLDSQATSIWDMGAIAAKGGEPALRLFKDVLVAAASLPGIFPPKMIAVESEGRRFEEMHVDGGAIMQMFVAPEPLILRRARDWGVSAVDVYALVNTTLQPTARATPMGAVPILIRSFELMLRSSYRNALNSIAAYCEINGFSLRAASVPEEHGGANMLRFDRAMMSKIFAHGSALAENDQLWSKVD